MRAEYVLLAICLAIIAGALVALVIALVQPRRKTCSHAIPHVWPVKDRDKGAR